MSARELQSVILTQGPAAHRYIREFVCATVRGDGEELRASSVYTSENQCSAYMTLIPGDGRCKIGAKSARRTGTCDLGLLDVLEESLLEHSHRSHHPWFTACVQFVQLHVGADKCRDEFCVRGCASSAASDVV